MNAFPDVESLLMTLLATKGTCVTFVPTDLKTKILTTPVIRINRTGGGDDRITDRARVSIDVFASSWEGARKTAEDIRQVFLAWPIKTSTGVIDEVITDRASIDIPWDDPDVFRRNASYAITTRR
jgi:hypothetical protein